MKNLFIGVLIANLLIEWFAAFVLISAPESLFAGASAEGALWARNYGFAALAVGSAVIWTWPSRDNIKAVGSVLGILLTFHSCIFLALATSGTQLGGTIAHAVMAVLCISLYTQRSNWCPQ